VSTTEDAASDAAEPEPDPDRNLAVLLLVVFVEGAVTREAAEDCHHRCRLEEFPRLDADIEAGTL
jgi:hypothetical protein